MLVINKRVESFSLQSRGSRERLVDDKTLQLLAKFIIITDKKIWQ